MTKRLISTSVHIRSLDWISGREENGYRNYFKIKLYESMGPGRHRTRDPWICCQTRFCRKARYRLRYAREPVPARELYRICAKCSLNTLTGYSNGVRSLTLNLSPSLLTYFVYAWSKGPTMSLAPKSRFYGHMLIRLHIHSLKNSIYS